MRRPQRFDERQHVALRPVGMLPQRTVTVDKVANWAKKRRAFKCSIKMTYTTSTPHPRVVLWSFVNALAGCTKVNLSIDKLTFLNQEINNDVLIILRCAAHSQTPNIHNL